MYNWIEFLYTWSKNIRNQLCSDIKLQENYRMKEINIEAWRSAAALWPFSVTTPWRAVKVNVAHSCSTLGNSRDCSPWDSPGQNTGVGSLSLDQGIVPTQGSNSDSRRVLYRLSHTREVHAELCCCVFNIHKDPGPVSKKYLPLRNVLRTVSEKEFEMRMAFNNSTSRSNFNSFKKNHMKIHHH